MFKHHGYGYGRHQYGVDNPFSLFSTKLVACKVKQGCPWFIFWIGDQMVLVVVTKGQQEALIPLAPVQKQ